MYILVVDFIAARVPVADDRLARLIGQRKDHRAALRAVNRIRQITPPVELSNVRKVQVRVHG